MTCSVKVAAAPAGKAVMVKSALDAKAPPAVVAKALSHNYPDDKIEVMKQAVRTVLSRLGEDVNREGLLDTPKRVAKAWLDASAGYRQDTAGVLGGAFFTEDIVKEGGNGIVIVRDIDFASTNEETLLPFHGRCHVGYVPHNGVVLGLSKLARLTKHFGKRLQNQGKLACDIAAGLQQHLRCEGVAVLVESKQLGPTACDPVKIVGCVGGCFAVDSAQFEEFIALMGVGMPSSDDLLVLPEGAKALAPAPLPDAAENVSIADMEAAINTMIRMMGEDPERMGLRGAALRYVRGLLASTSGYHQALPAREDAMAPLSAQAVEQVATVRGSVALASATLVFNSQCEHHMLPFYGKAMLAYVPAQGGGLLSQVALEQIVQMYTRRLQVQERITHQLADAVNDLALPEGVMVVCQAAHMCMLARGVENHSGATSTFAVRGVFESSPELRQHVLRAFAKQTQQ